MSNIFFDLLTTSKSFFVTVLLGIFIGLIIGIFKRIIDD